MKKHNLSDGAKHKQQYFSWPVWFPYPTSWLKSLVLLIFIRAIIFFLIENASKVGYRIVDQINSIELFILFTISLILSPIVLIAFTHQVFHLLVGHFWAEIQAPEIGKVKGLLPGLMSWWEGLYGWLVIIVSTLIAIFCCTFLMPLFDFNYTQLVANYTEYQKRIILLFGICYIISGAIIYQIEYLVKRRIISAYTVNPNQQKNQL